MSSVTFPSLRRVDERVTLTERLPPLPVFWTAKASRTPDARVLSVPVPLGGELDGSLSV